MKINLKDLVGIQREVDARIKENWNRPVNAEGLILAFNVELFEYFNAIGVWKWWKNSHVVDRDRVLDELADLFAFYISLVNLKEDIGDDKIVGVVEEELNLFYEKFDSYAKSSALPHKELVVDFITYVAVDSEMDYAITVTERFALAIYLSTLLFDDVTWDEITEAYRKKSAINIKRQDQNY